MMNYGMLCELYSGLGSHSWVEISGLEELSVSWPGHWWWGSQKVMVLPCALQSFLVSVVLHTGESHFLWYALLTLHRASLLLLLDPLTAWGSAQTLVAISILCFSLKADFISWPPFHLAIYVSYFSIIFQSSKGRNCFVSLRTHYNTSHVILGLVSGWLEVSQNRTHAAIRLSSSFSADQCSSSSASSDWRWWRSSRSTIVRNGKKYTVVFGR